MRKQLKQHIGFRMSTWETIIWIVAGVVTLAIEISMDSRRMPQKWHAAVIGSVLPFAVVIMGYRRWWLRWYFWLSLTLCLVIHVVAIWMIFEHVLTRTQELGTLQWFPIAFIETFVLAVVVKKVAEIITGKHESIKLS
jgi:hypothetical protein